MAYRGEDLDLRTPQSWTAPADPGALAGDQFINGPRSRLAAAGHGGPIWVDETVLACCNHAFDVALAHRSAEVRLDHLVYALTRIEAAADLLELRGVRVGALRRESATIVASEIPVGLPPGKATPRRSEDLEEVLRLAAAQAYRRSAPVAVGDILHVLFDQGADLPGMALLRPALQRAGAPAAFADAAPVPARVAMPAYLTEAARTSRPDLPAAQAEPAFASRIEALEQMVRALSSDLANEHKSLSGVLQNLQREVMAQRDDTGRLGPGYLDKYASERAPHYEHAVSAGRLPPVADVSFLSDRLGALERAVQTELGHIRVGIEALHARADATGDLSPLTARLDAVEDALLSSDVAQRLKTVEEAAKAERVRASDADTALLAELRALAANVDRQRGETASGGLEPVTEKLDRLSGTTESLHGLMSQMLKEAQDRITALESTLAEQSKRADEAQASYAQELGVLHDALVKLNANQHTLAGSIDARAQELRQTSSVFGGRLESLEKASEKPVAMLEALSGTVEKMNRLTVEKYYRRNRFWYWLFGTDDWLAASWPSQSARISEELKAIHAPLKK